MLTVSICTEKRRLGLEPNRLRLEAWGMDELRSDCGRGETEKGIGHDRIDRAGSCGHAVCVCVEEAGPGTTKAEGEGVAESERVMR